MRVARTLWSSAAQAQDKAGTATLPKVPQISDGNRPSWGPHGGRERALRWGCQLLAARLTRVRRLGR